MQLLKLRLVAVTLACCLVAACAGGDSAPAPTREPATIFTTLAAGSQHTCALTVEDRVMCWGVNRDSQLGVEPQAGRERRAHLVEGLEGVKAIAAGGDVSCALTHAGAAYCWGEPRKLGTGATAESHVPLPVAGLSSGVAEIAVGRTHACVLLDTGEAGCWGLNQFYQLGDGTRDERLAPVGVKGLPSAATAIYVNGTSTCAQLELGGVYCWGDRIYGIRDGGGNRMENLNEAPARVTQLGEHIEGLAAEGSASVCFLDEDRRAFCFGYNPTGILGNGTEVDTETPVEVAGLGAGVRDIDLGAGHACAVTAEGGVKCWGEVQYFENFGGRIPGTFLEDAHYGPSPVPIPGLESGVVAVATGREHVCVLREAGNVQCWGHNPFGQLGNGGTEASATPVELQLAPAQD